MVADGAFTRLYASIDALKETVEGGEGEESSEKSCIIKAKKYALDALSIPKLEEVPTGTDKNGKKYVKRGAVGTKTFRFRLRTAATVGSKTFKVVGLPMPAHVGLLDILTWVIADKKSLVSAVISPDGISYGIDENAGGGGGGG